jgi:hypothetical protein
MLILLIKKLIDGIVKYLAIVKMFNGLKKYVPYILMVAGVALLGFLSWCVNEFIRMVKQIFWPVIIYSGVSLTIYLYYYLTGNDSALYYSLLWPYYIVRSVL